VSKRVSAWCSSREKKICTTRAENNLQDGLLSKGPNSNS
jgi:hypothetical protein